MLVTHQVLTPCNTTYKQTHKHSKTQGEGGTIVWAQEQRRQWVNNINKVSNMQINRLIICDWLYRKALCFPSSGTFPGSVCFHTSVNERHHMLCSAIVTTVYLVQIPWPSTSKDWFSYPTKPRLYKLPSDICVVQMYISCISEYTILRKMIFGHQLAIRSSLFGMPIASQALILIWYLMNVNFANNSIREAKWAYCQNSSWVKWRTKILEGHHICCDMF